MFHVDDDFDFDDDDDDDDNDDDGDGDGDDDDDDLPMNWVCGIECSLRNDEANGGQ